MKNKPEPLKIAHFRFALIAPVIQGLYPDASEAAYYRRVTQDPILRPDGVSYKYSPDTLERWTGLYRKKGMDGLIPGFRKDKGVSRALSADAINEIYRLREKFPRINGVMIHQMLVQSGFIDAKVSVRAVQRFLIRYPKPGKEGKEKNKDHRRAQTQRQQLAAAAGVVWLCLPYRRNG